MPRIPSSSPSGSVPFASPALFLMQRNRLINARLSIFLFCLALGAFSLGLILDTWHSVSGHHSQGLFSYCMPLGEPQALNQSSPTSHPVFIHVRCGRLDTRCLPEGLAVSDLEISRLRRDCAALHVVAAFGIATIAVCLFTGLFFMAYVCLRRLDGIGRGCQILPGLITGLSAFVTLVTYGANIIQDIDPGSYVDSSDAVNSLLPDIKSGVSIYLFAIGFSLSLVATCVLNLTHKCGNDCTEICNCVHHTCPWVLNRCCPVACEQCCVVQLECLCMRLSRTRSMWKRKSRPSDSLPDLGRAVPDDFDVHTVLHASAEPSEYEYDGEPSSYHTPREFAHDDDGL